MEETGRGRGKEGMLSEREKESKEGNEKERMKETEYVKREKGVKERVAEWEEGKVKKNVKEEEGKSERGDPESPKSFTEVWWKSRVPSWTDIVAERGSGRGGRGGGITERGKRGRGRGGRGGKTGGEREREQKTPKIKRLGKTENEKGSTQKEKKRDREKEKGGNKGEDKEKEWRGTIKPIRGASPNILQFITKL